MTASRRGPGPLRNQPLVTRGVVRVEHGAAISRSDDVAVEEPLEIRAAHGVRAQTVYTTMRTPGDDAVLAVGHLVAEGIITGAADVSAVRQCRPAKPEATGNAIMAELRVPLPALPPRLAMATAACGVCGKESIANAFEDLRYRMESGSPCMALAHLLGLPARLRDAQPGFGRTGGLHAAGLFDADGELLRAFEDVGRHNALDKLIGWAALEDRLPLSAHVVLVSGRAGFELVQKCSAAGAPFLAAVGAPSSLAVDLATELQMTLIGFLRDERCTIYADHGRVTPGHS